MLQAKEQNNILISDAEQAAILQSARHQGIIDEEDTTVIFLNLDIIATQVANIDAMLPEGATNAVAIKANPLVGVLKYMHTLCCSVEAASTGEVELALHAGFEPNKIVFDSPAKTLKEIRWCEEHLPGAYINADSLEELAHYRNDSQLNLGLRINAGAKIDALNSMNVSGAASKFGVALLGHEEEIIAAIMQSERLNTLHIHQASQSSDYSGLAGGIQKIIAFADTINERAGYQKIATIDIGGGMPVNYITDEPYPIDAYFDLLRQECPQLFDGSYRIITEFGRYVHAHAGWVATQVQNVKHFAEKSIATVHAGADMMLRESYNPGEWHHKLAVLDADMQVKTDTYHQPWDIAGPLCFGGDFSFRGVTLPEMNIGDWLIIKDTGANTYALWSRHCSRQFPKVIAYSSAKAPYIMKQRETIKAIIEFWS